MAETINQEQIRKRFGEKNTDLFEKIRTYGCCACGSRGVIHMHHVRTRGAIGQVDEENVVPLCWKCHGEGHTIGWLSFQRKWGINLTELAVRFWTEASAWYEKNQMGRTEMVDDQGGQ